MDTFVFVTQIYSSIDLMIYSLSLIFSSRIVFLRYGVKRSVTPNNYVILSQSGSQFLTHDYVTPCFLASKSAHTLDTNSFTPLNDSVWHEVYEQLQT